MRTQTEVHTTNFHDFHLILEQKRQIQHHGNRPVNEMDQDYGNIATSEKVSLNISKEVSFQ